MKDQPRAGRYLKLRAAGRTAFEQFEFLRDAFVDPDSVDYWCWLNTEGWREDQRLRDLVLPIPPPGVYQFSNTSDDWGFLLTAAATYKAVMDSLQDLGVDVRLTDRVLDFGCGPGRGLRLFEAQADDLDLHGTDVDAVAIAWCRENLDFATFHQNSEAPPLQFPDAHFGLVLSISVFSHFSAGIAAAWLDEIARVLRPGGLALLSVHGRHALHRATEEPNVFAMLEVDRQAFAEASKRFVDTGQAFIAQPGGHLSEALYGVAFLDEAHVRRVWGARLEVVKIREAAVDDWQDLVVLRKT